MSHTPSPAATVPPGAADRSSITPPPPTTTTTTTAADRAGELLRSRGLRVTGPRAAVLAAVTGRPHADAEQVAALVRSSGAAVSRASVYSVLAALTADGLLRRVEPAGFPARYEPENDDNHHHLVCRMCGRTVDVACAVGSRRCLEPEDDHGFAVEAAEVTFWGRCAECRESMAAPPPPTAGAVPPPARPSDPVAVRPGPRGEERPR